MIRINVNLFPKDGYFFKEKDGAKIRADSWPAVMRKVEAYRRRANYPMGNVEQEVMQQACGRNPSHCSNENDALMNQRKVVSLKGRVFQYMAFMRGLLPNRIPWVSAQDAANRANVCAMCPHNTNLPEGCASCRAALRSMRNEILGPHRAKDSRLNGCNILGEDIQTSCHVDHDVVDNPSLPGHCWRKRRTP